MPPSWLLVMYLMAITYIHGPPTLTIPGMCTFSISVAWIGSQNIWNGEQKYGKSKQSALFGRRYNSIAASCLNFYIRSKPFPRPPPQLGSLRLSWKFLRTWAKIRCCQGRDACFVVPRPHEVWEWFILGLVHNEVKLIRVLQVLLIGEVLHFPGLFVPRFQPRCSNWTLTWANGCKPITKACHLLFY